ncbi:hypothetical protein ACL02R_06075 [Streptomyces sp. MS19]|uniref:hypothetical protein n=1 Tax=Streptomyces sp. MS19 TaxID=3385972 RepID=UPI0039A0B91B
MEDVRAGQFLGVHARGGGRLFVTAHFAAYTYVRPLLEERTGLGQGTLALVLLHGCPRGEEAGAPWGAPPAGEGTVAGRG